MNPLTLVKRIQNINSKEAQLGLSESASWHAKYKDSAYVFVGGIPFDLTEGDILAVFAQYGELVDVNLVRDKATGKSKGFAFVAYEDQRSTVLAVDNLNGAQILGRTIRVDHVSKYKKKAEEDEEEEQRKREERGVCRAFQRGDCTRGATCKFSHNEQRAANTGWGEQDTKWGRDKYDGPKKAEEDDEEHQRKREERGVCRAFQRGDCTRGATCKFSHNEQRAANTGWGEQDTKLGRDKYDVRKKVEIKSGTVPSHRGAEPKVPEDANLGDNSRGKGNGRVLDSHPRRSDEGEEKRLGRRVDEKSELRSRDYERGEEKRSRRHSEADETGPNAREGNGRREEHRSRRQNDREFQPKSRGDRDAREDRRSSRRGDDDEFEPNTKFSEDIERKDDKRGEDTRPKRHADDDLFEPKSREDRDKREYGRREDTRLKVCVGDDEVDPKSREYRDMGKGSRSYNDDEYQPKSRGDHDRSEGKRSRHLNDESELNSGAGLDKRARENEKAYR